MHGDAPRGCRLQEAATDMKVSFDASTFTQSSTGLSHLSVQTAQKHELKQDVKYSQNVYLC